MGPEDQTPPPIASLENVTLSCCPPSAHPCVGIYLHCLPICFHISLFCHNDHRSYQCLHGHCADSTANPAGEPSLIASFTSICMKPFASFHHVRVVNPWGTFLCLGLAQSFSTQCSAPRLCSWSTRAQITAAGGKGISLVEKRAGTGGCFSTRWWHTAGEHRVPCSQQTQQHIFT